MKDATMSTKWTSMCGLDAILASLMVAAALWGMSVITATAAVVVTADQDTRIDLVSPDINFGASTSTRIEIDPNIERAIVHFDLSAYTGTTVTGDVLLRWYAQAVGAGANGQTLAVYQVAATNAGWLTLDATWNNRAASTTTPWVNAANTGNYPGLGAPGEAYGATPVATLGLVGPVSGTVLSMNIPAAVVQGWINNASANAGLLFRFSDETAVAGKYLVFEAANQGYWPNLTFDYVVPEPGCLSLLVVGGALLRRRRAKSPA